MTIAEDLKFAAEALGTEFKTTSSMLRYVVAINPSMTVSEWVAAAQAAGYHAGSARNRFWESRYFDRDEYGYTIDKEGRLHGF